MNVLLTHENKRTEALEYDTIWHLALYKYSNHLRWSNVKDPQMDSEVAKYLQYL